MPLKAKLWSALALACLLALGCGQILGAGTYHVKDEEDGGPQNQLDGSPSGDGGADGCNPSPQSRSELESACTNGACVPFDDTRTKSCKAGANGVLQCPDLPPPVDAGPPPPPPDSGASEAGTDAGPPDAGPQLPPCSNVPPLAGGFNFPPTVVYSTGSTALSLYVAKIGQALAQAGVATIVYMGSGSCVGASAMVTAEKYPLHAIGKTGVYYDPSVSDINGAPVQYQCAIDEPDRVADVGISDVFAESCIPTLKQSGGLPNNLHDFYGPIQSMVFAVPTNSTQISISADAAYMVWGFGSQSNVAPWTDETALLQRSETSGTQTMMAAAINVDPYRWHGKKHSSSQLVLADLIAAALAGRTDPSVPEKTIAVLGADFADDNRDQVRVLAYQDRGKGCGYYPDSTPSAHDKQNVRDGHYPVWGPSHFILPVDGNEQPVKPAAKAFIDALSGTTPLANLDILQVYVQRHVVPNCAMHVTRSSDGGDYSPYKPPISCSCYFDLVATGHADCVSCKTTADCASAPHGATSCNTFGNPPVGFCEAPGPAR